MRQANQEKKEKNGTLPSSCGSWYSLWTSDPIEPKMKAYIFGARNGIYIIDLQKTVVLFKNAYDTSPKLLKMAMSCFVGAKAGQRCNSRRSRPFCHVLYQPSLARWNAHQFLDHLQSIKGSKVRVMKRMEPSLVFQKKFCSWKRIVKTTQPQWH
jgi:hypothetical protein